METATTTVTLYLWWIACLLASLCGLLFPGRIANGTCVSVSASVGSSVSTRQTTGRGQSGCAVTACVGAVSVELERIDQEITVEIEGVGFSLVNNITQTDVMYLGITRSVMSRRASASPGQCAKHKLHLTAPALDRFPCVLCTICWSPT